MVLKQILQTAERTGRKRDEPNIERLVNKALETKQDLPNSTIYADFLYLATCYADASGNYIVADMLIRTIKKEVPNYKSRERFDRPNGPIQWKGKAAEDHQEHELKYSVSREFRKFRSEHRGFKFNHLMEKYPIKIKDEPIIRQLHPYACH